MLGWRIVSPGSRTATFDRRHLPSTSLLLAALMLAGCASPGPPRPPSLQLPEPVHDLTATREGGAVTVKFTLPARTTDNFPIREGALKASLCSGPEGAPCTTLPTRRDVTLKIVPAASAADRKITWTDNLPRADISGEPRLLALRLQLSSLEGKTAGWSEPAYTASGTAPEPVEGFHAEETPSGILLHWQPAGNGGGEVLLHRENLAPPATKKKTDQSEPVWLITHADATGPNANVTLDTSAAEDVPYRYTAVRRRIVQLGQQKIELRSAISPPAEIAWRNLFPPPTPTGLTGAPFTENGGFAVDLVWDPVELPGLRGYIVTREAAGVREQLTPQPIPLPAFHDATAKPGIRYQYEVQAISRKGIHSAPAAVTIEPTSP